MILLILEKNVILTIFTCLTLISFYGVFTVLSLTIYPDNTMKCGPSARIVINLENSASTLNPCQLGLKYEQGISYIYRKDTHH